MTLKLGETVGSYRVVSQLGQGGMATVYKAYHANLDRYVAIKVLHPAFKEDTTFLARFQREARVLARLDHPNIVPIFDFAEHEGQPYLVMKYVEGQTLKGRLSHGPATPYETLSVVDAVGSALAYAHQQGVLHRDIKPSNVIITGGAQYYLSDFGLARIASAGESTLSQDTMLGTPNYISPEQAQGLTALDQRTDIYSFGVVLYELIVGRVPFSGDTPFSVIHDHIYSPLPLPSAINPGVTEPLERFLLKALAKNRDDRFPDVSAMVAAFHQAGGDQLPGAAARHAGVAPADPGGEPNLVANTLAMSSPLVAGPPAAPVVQAPANAPASTGTSPAGGAKTVAKPRSSAGRLNWQMVGGVAAILVCLALAGLLLAGRLARESRAQGTETAQAELTSVVPPTDLAATVAATAPDDVSNGQATVAADPNSIDGHLHLGRAYYMAGQTEAAVVEYDKAAELSHYGALFYTSNVIANYPGDPVFALTVLNDGLLHNTDRRLKLELWTLAAPLVEQAIPLPAGGPILETMARDYPDRIALNFALASHYVKVNQLDQAGLLISSLQQKYPDDPGTHFVHGQYLLATGNADAAIIEFRTVLTNPRAAIPLRRAAQQYLDDLKGTTTP